LENRTKIEPKEIPSRLIPRLLVVFTRQLEILVTILVLTISAWIQDKKLSRGCPQGGWISVNKG